MTNMQYLNVFYIGLLSIVLLAGCSKAREQLGIAREAPDEFAVVKRAPLAMPPDYSLRPPEPGSPRPQEQSMSEEAKVAVFGVSQNERKQAAESAEEQLLLEAGALDADPNIRQKVDAETVQLQDRNETVAKKILGIGSDSETPSATVVNAPEEAKRIQDNLEQGKAVTEGETPSIEE